MDVLVSCFMIVAPLTNTSNWLLPQHSTRHKRFLGFSLAAGFLSGGDQS